MQSGVAEFVKLLLVVLNVQKREQLHFDESQKLQQMQEFWKHKQLEMLEEEHRLTVENEVTHFCVLEFIKYFVSN